MSNALSYSVVYQGAYPPPQMSAGVRRVRDICRGLAAAGGNVRMIVPAHFGPLEQPSDTDFDVVSVGPVQDRPTVSSRLHFWKQVTQTVVRQAPDLCLFYDTTLDSYYAMQTIKRAGIAVGYELCDLFSTSEPKIGRRVARALAERFLPRVSQCNIVITRHIQQWVKKVAPATHSILIPGLFDTESFQHDMQKAAYFRERYGIDHSEVIVCYNGSWWKQKGLAMLVEAFKLARSLTETPMKLVVSGSFTRSPVEDDVSELAKQMNVEADVILPGRLPTEEVIGLLSAADVVVSSSTDDPFNHAAFPTKVAEYAGMGRPILATNVGDVPLYFEDGVNAVLTDAHSVASMADGLTRLARDSALRERLGNAAKQTSQDHFNFRRCGQRIDDDVRALLHENKCA